MHHLRSISLVGMLALLGACSDAVVSPVESASEPHQSRAEGYPSPGPQGTGWVYGPDGQPVEVSYEVHEGRAIFEGDIDLGPAGEIPATRASLERFRGGEGPRLGLIIDSSSRRWPSGTVAYVIDPYLPMQYRVTDAMAHIAANNPGVRFVPRTSHSDYVYITRSTGCSSAVGRSGGKQTINLADGCGTGSTIHELLHALGMGHEQSRCDRNSFVEILLHNVESGRGHNFERRCSDYSDVYGYDESSIMHYGPYAFSVNGQPTIRSLRGLDYLMGQRSGMSTADVNTVHWMYPAPLNLTATYPNGVPTLSWNALSAATGYDLYLVETEITSDQSGDRTSVSRRLVGSTTGTSLQDAQSSYTGESQCGYQGSSEYVSISYEYELVARLASGGTKTGYEAAQITTCWE
jgi:hypothetical protein